MAQAQSHLYQPDQEPAKDKVSTQQVLQNSEALKEDKVVEMEMISHQESLQEDVKAPLEKEDEPMNSVDTLNSLEESKVLEDSESKDVQFLNPEIETEPLKELLKDPVKENEMDHDKESNKKQETEETVETVETMEQ